MELNSPLLLCFIAFVFGLAGLVKGVIGLGLPTVAVGLLGLVMLPSQAVVFLLAPSLLTNVLQLATGPAPRAALYRFRWLSAGILAGTWAGIAWLPGADTPWAGKALGLALVLYGLIGLAGRNLHVPPAWEQKLALPVGVATGLVSALTGVFVLPAVPYLQGLGLQREELVEALGVSFTVSTVALLLGLGAGGLMGAEAAGVSLLALFPALGGMMLGQYLRQRLAPALFRRLFFWGLLALGGYLLLRGGF